VRNKGSLPGTAAGGTTVERPLREEQGSARADDGWARSTCEARQLGRREGALLWNQGRQTQQPRTLTMSLPSPTASTVEKLQKSLHEKAKSEANFRFYSLWDKVCRTDVLAEAYRRCRRNGGAAGVDREVFSDIEDQGREAWLANLQQELRSRKYAPAALRRVWIPKSNGGQRPLGIPTIRDRVVQMAALLVLGPIFEADLLDEQYGFRERLDAKMAVRRVYFHLTRGHREVVDGDLRDYFNVIPHGPLMKSVARRVSDGSMLSVMKAWLNAPVVERTPGGEIRSTAARDGHRGTPQGGVISPLLANLYFRRFALAFRSSRTALQAGARLVNYADDFVICCRPGKGAMAMEKMRELMGRLGLTVNEQKTRLVKVPEAAFDFLGYTLGRFYGKGGRPYLGTRPSKKSISRVLGRIHEETSTRWITTSAEKRVEELNPLLRGWCGYFDQGPVLRPYRLVKRYTERRLRRWLMKKHKRRGAGYRQYPDEFLYEKLGLFNPLAHRVSRTRAKA
jgi:RNA-directed DNA polymerase